MRMICGCNGGWVSFATSSRNPFGREATVAITRVAAAGAVAAASWIIARGALAQGVYMEVEEFLSAAFPNDEPVTDVLWVSDELRASAEALLSHRFDALRVRYWTAGGRTAWILDEIGKEKPITVGITVDAGAVRMVRVLEFRESRGWEVRYPFFTDQFKGVRFGEARSRRGRQLSRRIDGITGATLSVRAVTRVVQMALLLDEQVGGGG